MVLPLEGVRVVEWAQYQTGPAAGMMLADLGADVIKIEDPVGGDQARGAHLVSGMHTYKSGRNAWFEINNRNKRGITLNLKSERGRAIALELVEKSDVFLTNFIPSLVLSLGMDYETLRARNPRLIYAAASGYGPNGPSANTRAFDFTAMARSGIMTMTGEPDMPPLRIETGIADEMGAIMTAYGVLTALFLRERTGIGQRVDSSILGAMAWLQTINLAFRLIGGEEYKRKSRKSSYSPLWNYYECADGKWVALAHMQADRFWPNVCRALGIEHLQDDPKYADMTVRGEHCVELIAIMDEVFRSKPRADWIKILDENGCIAGPLNDFDDLVVDPDMLANNYIIDYDHPAWGPMKYVGFPIGFSETPLRMRRPGPEHGEHTEEVLQEMLGYDWDELIKLRDEGVIR